MHDVDADEPIADERQAILREIAAAHDVTIGQIALAWVHSRGPAHGVNVVPLPGTTRVDHALANIAAGAISLDPAELEKLTDAWEPER